MIGTLTRRNIGSHKGRSIIISLSIMLGVAFVSASFMVADSLRATFDNLFNSLSDGVDLEVRSQLAFGDATDSQRDPISIDLRDQIAGVEGVADTAVGLSRSATIIDKDGEPVKTSGAPTLAVAWDAENNIGGAVIRDGRLPAGPDEVVIDKATADKYDFEVGDPIEIVVQAGREQFTLVGLSGLGNTDSFGGATVVSWDLATSQELLQTGDLVDAIDIRVAEGAETAAVQARLEEVLPANTEVVTGQQLADETKDAFGVFIGYLQSGLLAFAFITLFVSAFIINNTFAITIGQRLRELALLRAVGASGRQVRRLIVVEALVLAAVATVVGIVAGLGVSRLIVFLFNQGGAGFPPSDMVLKPRTIIVAAVVGLGVTLASVLIPARRASRIPPVAAMRPELGFEALTSGRRIVLGAIVTAIGTAMFLIGIFLSPGGSSGLIFFGGVGALVLFLGVASLSTTFARPVSKALGWPLARFRGSPGKLAQENAARSPKRTASTASALMIGVALVSAATVFASSLKKTFVDVLEGAVTADYIITDESFQGLPTAVAEQVAALPEIATSMPVRGTQVQIDGDAKSVGAVDPAALDSLFDIGLLEGSVDGLEDGVFVYEDPAKDLGLTLGDQVAATFQNGEQRELTVAGIYDDASLVGNWLISLDTLSSVSAAPPTDFFVVARLVDTVTPEEGRVAIDALTEQYPQMKIQDQAEYRDELEGQIDQLLVIITVLLTFAIIIAILGIAITLALSVYERTREIGLMRAVGMTRRQTRRMIRGESIIVTLFGGVVGVVVGCAIGVALSVAVPDTVINTLVFPVSEVVTYLIVAILAGVVAAFYPARKASKMNVLEAIATT